jgi:hypothetical protein
VKGTHKEGKEKKERFFETANNGSFGFQNGSFLFVCFSFFFFFYMSTRGGFELVTFIL